jgi:hypothetical protein
LFGFNGLTILTAPQIPLAQHGSRILRQRDIALKIGG